MTTLAIWILVAHGISGSNYSDAYRNPYSTLQFASKGDCIDAAQKVSTSGSIYTCENIRVIGKYPSGYRKAAK